MGFIFGHREEDAEVLVLFVYFVLFEIGSHIAKASLGLVTYL